MSLPLPQPLFLLGLALAFLYFMLAGARTFERDDSDDMAVGLAQFSFLCTGALAAWFLGRWFEVGLWNAVGAAPVLVASLALYEWARRTIRHRGFHIAWSGDVPDTVCEAGPYGYVRHPVYAGYMLAFLALLIAMPTVWTVLIMLFNVALFTHAALSDERSLAAGPLADAYANYRKRVGMFFPRLT